MDREDIDTLLQDSAYFRLTHIALQQSCEQTLSILATALSRQIVPASKPVLFCAFF